MSAHDQIRKMLDELMGTGRDGEVRHDQMHFTDTRVCRSFLSACCPHEVLANTRMDMGDCIRHHDPALRADFEKAQKEKDYYYDIDALENLERFFDDMERKMELSRKRLAETQEETDAEVSDKANKVLELNEDIGKTLAEAERLGELGQVEESLKMMEKVEELRKTKREAEQDYRNSIPASSYQQQKLRLCEVCGAFLGIHDNDRRLADHFGGKLHMGFVFLRTKMDELRAKEKERRVQRDRSRGGASSSREYAMGGGGGGGGGGRGGGRYYGGGGGGSRDYDNERGDRRRRSRSRDRNGGRGGGGRNRSRSPGGYRGIGSGGRSGSKSPTGGGDDRRRQRYNEKNKYDGGRRRSRSPRGGGDRYGAGASGSPPSGSKE